MDERNLFDYLNSGEPLYALVGAKVRYKRSGKEYTTHIKEIKTGLCPYDQHEQMACCVGQPGGVAIIFASGEQREACITHSVYVMLPSKYKYKELK